MWIYKEDKGKGDALICLETGSLIRIEHTVTGDYDVNLYVNDDIVFLHKGFEAEKAQNFLTSIAALLENSGQLIRPSTEPIEWKFS